MAGLISLAGSAIGAAGNIIGGSTQASGQQAAADTQMNMFNAIKAQEQPFIQSGYGAVNMLDYLLGIGGSPTGGGGGKGGSMALGPVFSPSGQQNNGAPSTPGFQTSLPAGYLTQQFDPSQVANSPAFKFSLQTGGQALRNADTPGIGALSGAALKDLMSFNQGTAQSYYNNYFNQFQSQQNNIFNRLSSLAGLGQNAAGNLGNQGAQLGTGIAQAQAAAAGSMGAAYSSALNNLGGSAMLYGMLNGGNSGYDSSGISNAINSSNVGNYEGSF